MGKLLTHTHRRVCKWSHSAVASTKHVQGNELLGPPTHGWHPVAFSRYWKWSVCQSSLVTPYLPSWVALPHAHQQFETASKLYVCMGWPSDCAVARVSGSLMFQKHQNIWPSWEGGSEPTSLATKRNYVGPTASTIHTYCGLCEVGDECYFAVNVNITSSYLISQ